MAFALYAATAALLFWLAHRYITPIGRTSAVILFLIPLLFTGRALLTGGVYAPLDLIYAAEPFNGMKAQYHIGHVFGSLSDVACQMTPWRAAVYHAFRAREWPLWNPYILSGDILAATAQPAVYSPFTWIAVILPIAVSMTFTAAILHFIAALGGFLFAREIGCSEEASWFGAAGWALCTALTVFILWPDAHAFALFPLVLLGTRRVALAPNIRSSAILMIAFSLMIVSGHPETLLHTVTIAIPYGIFLLATERSHIVRSIAYAAAAGIIALALTAVQMLPLLEAMPQSSEYQFRHEVWSKTMHAARPGESRARLLGDVIPYLLGRHWRDPNITQVSFDSLAAGSLVLAIAFLGLWRGRGRERFFLAGALIFCVAARMAVPLFAALIRPIPGLNIAINERFAFAGAFMLAMLAALGIDALCADRLQPVGRLKPALTLLAIAIGLGAGTWYVLHHDPTDLPSELRMYPIAGELIPLAAAIPIAALFRARVAAAALLVLLAIQRILTVGLIYPTFPAQKIYPDVPMFAVMNKTREPFRVVGTGGALLPATSAIYKLEDVRGYTALTNERYMATFPLWCVGQPVWFNRVDDLTRPFLSFLNVRYAITGMREPPPGWHVVAEANRSRILENEHVLPRAFIPPVMIVGSTSADQEMAATSDFGQRAWIDSPVPRHEEINGPGSVFSIENRPNGLRVRVTMNKPGRVIVSETAWKGWRAFIDGQPAQTQIANLAFLSVLVPAGAHRVRLEYRPDSFLIGRAISFTTLVALLIFGIAIKVRGAASPVPESPAIGHP
jgi:membrane protein YfhO